MIKISYNPICLLHTCNMVPIMQKAAHIILPNHKRDTFVMHDLCPNRLIPITTSNCPKAQHYSKRIRPQIQASDEGCALAELGAGEFSS